MRPIDHIPLWALSIVTVAIVLLAVETGFRLGAFFSSKSKPEHESSVGMMVQATLALLAFLLAFTFGIASDRFNDRRVLIIEEANAIGTTYLRADFLPEANRKVVQNLLREYVDLRVRLQRDPNRLRQALADSNQLQQRLWQQAVTMGRANLDSDVAALFIESLNEMIDLQSKRIAAGLYARIPENIWETLYLMVFLAIAAMGYQAGTAGARNWPITGALALSFAIVMVMIADLDRPMEGVLKASQQPLIDLSNRIGPPTPGRQ
ncbi:MAG TPA: hypothetical protein V6D08_09190 [Candidatus Obscuribacterales bacterium]